MATLVKLKIEAFKDSAAAGAALGSMVAMMNPETYSRTFNAKYTPSTESGATGPTMIFEGIGQSDLELKLVVDGTGVVPLPSGISSVDDYITKFKALVYDYQGDEHRPNYIKVTWGSGLTFTGVCLSMTVNYTLFKPDGTSLRANISFKLTASTDFKTKGKEAQKNSPDLTHVRIVKAGDTLPLMAYRIYGDSAYYLEVARINQLKSVSAIKPGDRIYFPPIKK